MRGREHGAKGVIMAKYNMTYQQRMRLQEAIQHHEEAFHKAQQQYGAAAVKPAITIDETTIEHGVLQIGDRPEYQRMIRLLEGTTPEQFLVDPASLQGLTEFDKRLGKSVTRYSTKVLESRLQKSEERLAQYSQELLETRDRSEYQTILEQQQAERQRQARLRASLSYSPMDARDREQFESRVRARLYSTGSGARNYRDETYKNNFLKSMLINGLATLEDTGPSVAEPDVFRTDLDIGSTPGVAGELPEGTDLSESVNNVYAAIMNMDASEFVDFIAHRPDLEIKDNYINANSLDYLNELWAALSRWQG